MIPVTIRQPKDDDGNWSQETKEEILMFTDLAVKEKKPIDTWCLVQMGDGYLEFYAARTEQVLARGIVPAYIPTIQDLENYRRPSV